jgi:hypothetical protein
LRRSRHNTVNTVEANARAETAFPNDSGAPKGRNDKLSNIEQIQFDLLRIVNAWLQTQFPTEKESEQANLAKLVDAIEDERRDQGKPMKEKESSDTEIA